MHGAGKLSGMDDQPPTLTADVSSPEPVSQAQPVAPRAKASKVTIVLCILAGLILLLLVSAGIYYWYNFHGSIKPTELSQPEQVVLSEKLEVVTGEPVEIHPDGIEGSGQSGVITSHDGQQIEVDEDQIYAEDRRTLILTEREINGFLHHNTDLAERIHVVLGKDTITAKTITHFQPETPMIGGKTLRVNFTLGAYLDANGQFALEVRDVSAGGVPIPNAWLGDIKNKNLIDLGDNPEGSGILQKIADGIADFKVENSQIRIRLNE